jgi:hypothetical protein
VNLDNEVPRSLVLFTISAVSRLSGMPDVTTRVPFAIRRLEDCIGWHLTDYQSLIRDATDSLAELELITEEVKQKWPLSLGETIRNAQEYPEIRTLAARRDRLSIGTLIFSAMAVEAFLNYYGVLRMGEKAYRKHFERLSGADKLSVLLLVCDRIAIGEDDALFDSLRALTTVRNTLVHPKAKEMKGYVPAELRNGLPVPNAARNAVKNMKKFFGDFLAAVPAAKHVLPDLASEPLSQ